VLEDLRSIPFARSSVRHGSGTRTPGCIFEFPLQPFQIGIHAVA
jgi:hypothetical protein